MRTLWPLLLLCACGRSTLLARGGGGAEGGGGEAPAPPRCAEVAYEVCRLVTDAPTVIASGVPGGAPDVAWLGGHFVVVFRQEAATRVAAATVDGDVLWDERVGPGGSPRIAAHPTVAAGAVLTDRGVGYLDHDGRPIGDFFVGTPFASDTMNGSLAPIADGFVGVVGPTSDPGGQAQAVKLLMSLTPGSGAFVPFYPDTPTPRIDRSLGADGLLHRFGFEANGDGIELVTFGWEGGTLTLATPPASQGSGTSFVDGFFSDGTRSSFIYGNDFGFAIVTVDETGEVGTTSTLVESGDAAGFTAARLATASAGLGPVVIEIDGLVADQVTVARLDALTAELSDPIPLGPRGRDARLQRWDRGLVVVWSDTDTDRVLLRALDCCRADMEGG
ncbi:MAG: hypothetical protein R3B72_19185 [Polyangiaceae bacterium]